jgi:hypothetical protein
MRLFRNFQIRSSSGIVIARPSSGTSRFGGKGSAYGSPCFGNRTIVRTPQLENARPFFCALFRASTSHRRLSLARITARCSSYHELNSGFELSNAWSANVVDRSSLKSASRNINAAPSWCKHLRSCARNHFAAAIFLRGGVTPGCRQAAVINSGISSGRFAPVVVNVLLTLNDSRPSGNRVSCTGIRGEVFMTLSMQISKPKPRPFERVESRPRTVGAIPGQMVAATGDGGRQVHYGWRRGTAFIIFCRRRSATSRRVASENKSTK